MTAETLGGPANAHPLWRVGPLPDFTAAVSSGIACTGLFSEADFLAHLREAAADSGRSVRVLESWGQPGDHPVHLHCPESRYLGCVLLQVD